MRWLLLIALLACAGCSSDGAAFRFDDSASSGSKVELFPWSGASTKGCCGDD